MEYEQIFCSFSKNNRLYKIWLAGANWKEFQRIMKPENIWNISVPLICQDVMKTIQSHTDERRCNEKKLYKAAKITKSLSFLEFTHLIIGTVYVFEYQVKFLYDQVLQRLVQQSNLQFEFDRQPNFLNASTPDNPKTSPSMQNVLKRHSRNSSDQQQGKRIKLSKDMKVVKQLKFNQLHADELTDVELENEVKMALQKSEVMRNGDISILEVEEEPDTVIQMSQFEADDDLSMQYYHQIQKLVKGQPSLQDVIRHDHDHVSLPNSEQETFEYDERPEVTNILEHAGSSPLALNQSHVNGEDLPEAQEHVDIEHPVNAPSHLAIYKQNSLSDMSIYQSKLNVNVPSLLVNNATSRDINESIPHVLELTLNDHGHRYNEAVRVPKYKNRKRKRRVADIILQIDHEIAQLNLGRSELIDKDVLYTFDLQIFIKPAHMFGSDIKLRFRHFQKKAYSEKLLAAVNRVKLRKPSEETDFDMVNKFLCTAMHDQNPIPVAQNNGTEVSCNTFDQMGIPIDDNNYAVLSPVHPVHTELFQQNHEQIPLNAEWQNKSDMELPHQILRVLNLCKTAGGRNSRCTTHSQKTFMINNQENRNEWDTKGVIKQLFSLWNSNIHPIGMTELVKSSKSKVAAALAFFSVLELNSPRIGLITIEKKPDSHSIQNITKSQKLIDILENI